MQFDRRGHLEGQRGSKESIVIEIVDPEFWFDP